MSRHRNVGRAGLTQAVAIVLILLSSPLFSSCSRDRGGAGDRARTSARPGTIAPDFTLQDLHGRDVTLSQLRGKVVLLEFWATWCPPCRATVPELVALQGKFKGRGFTVLGISVDDEDGHLRAELSEFSGKFHINYPVLVGSEAVERDYKVWSIPQSFLIDKNGKIRDSYSGYIDQYESKVSSEVERLL